MLTKEFSNVSLGVLALRRPEDQIDQLIIADLKCDINGTGYPIQIKSTRLVVGGSPCYSLATREYDKEQGILHAGGVILFFGWGAVPNLLQAGNICMHIETNGFVSIMADHKSSVTTATALPGYQVGFLEKSYDDIGWWAKYWLLVRSDAQY